MLRENQVVCDCDLATAIVIKKTSEAHCQWYIALFNNDNPRGTTNPSTLVVPKKKKRKKKKKSRRHGKFARLVSM